MEGAAAEGARAANEILADYKAGVYLFPAESHLLEGHHAWSIFTPALS